MEYVHTDAGRSKSKRPKSDYDHIVIAFANAFDVGFDRAFDLFDLWHRKLNRGFDIGKFMMDGPTLGYTITEIPRPRISIEKFANKYKDGIYIIRVAKAVLAVVNGKVMNENYVDCNKKVYVAYQIQRKIFAGYK